MLYWSSYGGRNMTCGVYKIINIASNKFYIGKSIHIENRWRQHKNNLERNGHVNTHLQNAWNKYGTDNFKFQIIESVDSDKLCSVEQKYLDMYFGLENCYNMHCKSSDGTTGYKHSSETIARMRGRRRSLEGRKNISEARKKCDFGDTYSIMQKGIRNNKAKSVIGISVATGETVRYSYMRDAKADGFEHAGISRVCRGKLPHYKGFVWQYIDEVNNVLK